MFSMKYFGWTSILVIGISTYFHVYHNSSLIDLLSQYPVADNLYRRFTAIFDNMKYTQESRGLDMKTDEMLLTVSELGKFNGKENNEKLYLGILGQIFDVTKGRKHYGPGGGYHFFTGKDASRAFVTGDFSDQGLTDDVLNLSPEQLRGIKGWLDFYQKEYVYIGKLIGRYYDSEGKETAYLMGIRDLIKTAELEKDDAAAQKLKYPPCNSEWSLEKGSRVWCTKRSGGIDRNWIGVPRKLYVLGSQTPRCACIQYPEESSSSSSDESPIRNPHLEEYPGCPKDSISCWIKQ